MGKKPQGWYQEPSQGRIGLNYSNLAGHFAKIVDRGRGNVIKLWSEITSGSS